MCYVQRFNTLNRPLRPSACMSTLAAHHPYPKPDQGRQAGNLKASP